jgi:hypothetical protein
MMNEPRVNGKSFIMSKDKAVGRLRVGFELVSDFVSIEVVDWLLADF